MKSDLIRQYDIRNAAAFRKTKEQWGSLSNMAGGFPVVVNNIRIQSAESLYQACRFPLQPEIQEQILLQRSPMEAKKIARSCESKTRPDWNRRRVLIMKWCLRVKLAQNWEHFSKELEATKDMSIVEVSSKDGFWGAIPEDHNICTGANVLGRLLMELRSQLYSNSKERFWTVPPLNISNFDLCGSPITTVYKPLEDSSSLSGQQTTMF